MESAAQQALDEIAAVQKQLGLGDDYQTLKLSGFSAFKAAEICLDAKRGCKLAQAWLVWARQHVEGKGNGNEVCFDSND